MATQIEIIEKIKEGELAWLTYSSKESKLNPKTKFEIIDYDFSNYDFSGWLLAGISFQNVNFEKTNFQNARILRCFFGNCNLQNANFENANLGYYENKEGHKVKDLIFGSVLVECNLSNAIMRNVDLRGCMLSASDLRNTDLTNSNLSETLLAFANGRAVRMNKSILKGITLPTFSDKKNKGFGRFTDLALAEGLEEAVFDNDNILKSYLGEVFSIIHKNELGIHSPNETYSSTLLSRIKAIELIYERIILPTPLIRELSELKQDILLQIKKKPSVLKDFKGRLFEELVAELLSSYGWEIDLTQRTRDGGYDIFAISKDVSGLKSSWLIECKGWKDTVGIDVVRALYGVKSDLKVGHALLATTSQFSPEVHKYQSSRYDLELKDYNGLIEWINHYKPKEDGNLYYK